MMVEKKKFKITLQKPDLINDGSGGRKPKPGGDGWATVTQVWANIKTSQKASLLNKTGTIVSDVTANIYIWTRTDIVDGWRIRYKEKIYKVNHTYDLNDLEMVLICREDTKP